jgi:hypothetical protein
MKTVAIACLFSLLLASASIAADFKVIVNPKNPIHVMSAADVSAMLMKKTTKWPDGTQVQPVDQVEAAAARISFSRDVLHKEPAAVKGYWRQQIFGGYDVPPVELKNDAEVIKFVREHLGAIGYVSDQAPLAGVKTVEIRGADAQ